MDNQDQNHAESRTTDSPPSPRRAADFQHLYKKGNAWIHRTYPLTKLAFVPVFTVAGVAFGGYQIPAGISGFLIVLAFASQSGRLVLKSMRLLIPITLSLFLIHAPFGPENVTEIFSLGPVAIYREGTVFAATTASRLSVFVISIALALWTTHPKAFVTSLIQKGVSHKLCYSYLAGAELIPDMRQRAKAITEAQQARGFDTKGGLRRRVLTAFAMLKPLLVGALISVETRSLALESRGFSIVGPRTSTCQLHDTKADQIFRRIALILAGGLIVAGFLV